jgi:hypothetical protein
MAKLKKTLTLIACFTTAILTAPFWLPLTVYGFLYLETQLLGGRCGGSPVGSYISNEECSRGSASPITTTNANKPIGSTAECPLLMAIGFANYKVFTELLEKRAEPKLCKGYPDRFFESLSNCKNDKEMAKQFLKWYQERGIEHSNPNRLLLSQARLECIPGIQLAVAQGANIEAETADGLNSLHYTTLNVSEESIQATVALVALKADPMKPTSKLESPYVIAERKLKAYGNWPRMESALKGKVTP